MPVTPPITVTVDGTTVGQANLTWTDRNNPGFAGLDHYLIERSPDLVTFTTLGNVSAGGTLAYTDSTVTPGTFNWYRLTAQDVSNTQLYAPGAGDVWTNITGPSFWIYALENLTGPFGVGVSWGYVDPSQTNPVGSLVYPPALIAGATVEICCVITTGGVSTFVLALNNAALAQSAFTSIAFVDNASTTETYLTSGATFTTSGGLAIWTWPTSVATPFNAGENYLMSVSGGGAVSVPNVVGDVLSIGEAALVSAGLVTGTVTTAGSPTVPPGDIISSNPVAGTSVASGSSVDLVNSTGVAVPNVVNETLAQAEIDILAAGLTLGAVTTATSITILYGNVISESPAAGTAVAGGSAVDMVESIGLPNETIPNVVGEVLATGEAALVAAGLVTGVVTSTTSITIAAGSIISQSLLGTAVYGTAIDLVESTGLPTVPVPNVVGMALATASATLVAAGFVPGTVTTATSITIPGGSIISQSVTGTALYGTTVNMVESSGLPTVTVPNVITDTVATATTALVAANLVLGVVSTGYSDTIPNGEVMAQSVTGTALYGTPVDLVLSLGPPLIFPAVIGQDVVTATATLASEGLTLGQVIEGVSEDYPIGIIYAYSPPGGVPPASTVDLFVSSLYLSPNGAKYAARITSEHNQKPKYMALVNFLCSVMGDIAQACAAIPAAFDLDLAVGNQLDIIGLWVGQPRVIQSILLTGFFGFADDVEALPFGELTDPSKGGRWYELNEPSTGTATLGDTAYRTLLKARIIRNQSNGTTPEIEASLLDIFGAPCIIADAGTLSLAITVPVPITPEEEALVGPLDLLPRPAGVAIGSITYTG
jgi:beta-lactam-binding protein with PASTA domain